MFTGWILIVSFVGGTGVQGFSAGPFSSELKCHEAGIAWAVLNRNDPAINGTQKSGRHYLCAKQ